MDSNKHLDPACEEDQEEKEFFQRFFEAYERELEQNIDPRKKDELLQKILAKI